MKIRTGFVSNSSSTSFYIDASKYNDVDVAYSMKMSGSAERDFDISHATGLEVAKQIADFEIHFADGMSKEELIARLLKFLPHNCIVVDSNDDNSICSESQDMLVGEYDAYRQHWG